MTVSGIGDTRVGKGLGAMSRGRRVGDTVTAPGGPAPNELRKGALGTGQVLSASVANIGPAIGVLFSFGVIASTAGIASGFVILVAGIGYIFHVNSTAQYSRAVPSAGSYVTFLGRTFGPGTGAATGMAYLIAWTGIASGFVLVPAEWTSTAVQGLFHVNLPWWVALIVLEAITIVLLVSGVSLSTKVAIWMFGFEVLALMAGAINMLVNNAHYISASFLDPSKLAGGFSGLGPAFPLAIYLLIGASASAPLAEEVRNPKRAVPVAVFGATVVAVVLFLFLDFSLMAGAHNSPSLLSKPVFPFLTYGGSGVGAIQDLLYIGGFTSGLGVLLASGNASSRIIFNLGREGVLPCQFGLVSRRWGTPWVSIVIPTVAFAGLAGLVGGLEGALNGYAYMATLGTILYTLIFVAVNIGLPVYFWTRLRDRFSVFTHLVCPVLGTIAFAYPVWESIKPGQPHPYNLFGIITVLELVVAIGYGVALCRLRPDLRVGAHIADEEAPAYEVVEVPAMPAIVE